MQSSNFTLITLHQDRMWICTSCKTFTNILESLMPHARVSLSSRGICYKCLIFRDSVQLLHWMLSRRKRRSGGNIWMRPMQLELPIRILFMWPFAAKDRYSRLDVCMILFDFARHLSVTFLPNQSMNEWFCQNWGYRVNKFVWWMRFKRRTANGIAISTATASNNAQMKSPGWLIIF